MPEPLVVIAVGGHALIADEGHMTVGDQLRAAGKTAVHIAAVVRAGYRVLVTHGNGPQVGFILMRAEHARDILHPVPLESCVADTQGAIGYQMAQSLRNVFDRFGVRRRIVAVITQALVDAADPAFDHPTKPIGPALSREDAERHRLNDGWHVREERPGVYRRVVASPRPLEMLEEETLRALVDDGTLVIAGGGGGIPVVRESDGTLAGRPAVIDKDRTSALLASRLNAEILAITTSVDRVALNFGRPDCRWLDRLTVSEAERRLAEGHFAEGSMGPKIEAAVDFLKAGGRRAVITRPDTLERALAGEAGTWIVPDGEPG